MTFGTQPSGQACPMRLTDWQLFHSTARCGHDSSGPRNLEGDKTAQQ